MLIPALLAAVGIGALVLGKTSAPKSYPLPPAVPDPFAQPPAPQPMPQPSQKPDLPYDPGYKYPGANADPNLGPVVPIDFRPDSPPSTILPGQEIRLRERPIY